MRLARRRAASLPAPYRSRRYRFRNRSARRAKPSSMRCRSRLSAKNALPDQPGDHRCRGGVEHRNLPDPERPDLHRARRTSSSSSALGLTAPWCWSSSGIGASRWPRSTRPAAGRPRARRHLQMGGIVASWRCPGRFRRQFRDRFNRAEFRRLSRTVSKAS